MFRRNRGQDTNNEGGGTAEGSTNSGHPAGQVNIRVQETDVSSLLFSAGVSFAKRNKRFVGAYIIGLIVLLFAAGVSVTPEQERKYASIMTELEEDKGLLKVRQKWMDNVIRAEHHYQQVKGWFVCNQDCVRALKKRDNAYNELYMVDQQILDKQKEAKSHLGIFSDYSIQEIRDLFWGIFSKGREFSQQSSWFDLLFLGIDSIGRDEHIVAFMIRWLFQVIMNFTIGMIGTFLAFCWYVGDVVWSYNPGYLEGFLVVALAILAAFSMITSFLLTLYLSAAGTVFVAARVAGPALLENAARQHQARVRQNAYYSR